MSSAIYHEAEGGCPECERRYCPAGTQGDCVVCGERLELDCEERCSECASCAAEYEDADRAENERAEGVLP